jgi:capsid protein
MHLFERLRPGQIQGVPWFAPAIVKLRDLDESDDAELVRKKIEACFAAFVTGDEEAAAAGHRGHEHHHAGHQRLSPEPGADRRRCGQGDRAGAAEPLTGHAKKAPARSRSGRRGGGGKRERGQAQPQTSDLPIEPISEQALVPRPMAALVFWLTSVVLVRLPPTLA